MSIVSPANGALKTCKMIFCMVIALLYKISILIDVSQIKKCQM